MTDFIQMLNQACAKVDAYIESYNASRIKLREIMGVGAEILHHARQDPDGFIKACADRGVNVSDRTSDELAMLVIKSLFHRQDEDQRQRFNIRALVLCAALKEFDGEDFVAEDVVRWIEGYDGGLTKIAQDYRAANADDIEGKDVTSETPKLTPVRQKNKTQPHTPQIVIDPVYLSKLVAQGGRINLIAEISEEGNLEIISSADPIAANDNAQTHNEKEAA